MTASATGRKWENEVKSYLQRFHGSAAHRPTQRTRYDVGDLHLSPAVLQCKDEATHRFSAYLDDVHDQTLAAGESFGVAVVRRRGRDVEDAYAVMTLADFSLLIGLIRDCES